MPLFLVSMASKRASSFVTYLARNPRTVRPHGLIKYNLQKWFFTTARTKQVQAWQQPFLLFKETNKSNKFIAPEARCTLRRSFLSTTAKSASLCAASNVSLGQLRPHSYVHMLSLHTSHVHGSRPNFRACQIKHLTTAQVGQTENCLPTQPWHPNKQGQTKSPYRVCQISGQGSFKKSAEMTRIKANTITCIRPTWKQINPAQLP